ncbi:MAG: murein hydrolase activator EnvC family protein [Opitutales bacterium]
MRLKFGYVVLLLPLQSALLLAELVWPTPNQAFLKGEPIEAFVQATASGKIESGLFGCVREEGRRFHEALDLFPVERDAKGEATDLIFSVLPGRVVYINDRPGWSSYGRYVVVRHDGESPAFHSLYAHLASVHSGIKEGGWVKAGAVLGVMGRSAGGYVIPKSRAHLHFEIGLMLSENFEAWFKRQNFKSPNRHGSWNGMNLVSVDPLGFYRAVRAGNVLNFDAYLRALPVAARLRVFFEDSPAFIRNYPGLLSGKMREGKLVAWDIAFTDFGVPKSWTPRYEDEGLLGNPGEVHILSYAPDRLKAQPCQRVLDFKGGGVVLSKQTKIALELLFGFH